MKFSDSHCHLDFDELSAQGKQLLTQCAAKNIHRIVVPAIAPSNWQQVLNLADTASDSSVKILPALGIHPWFLTELGAADLDSLSQLVQQHQQTIVAIGETGIDGTIAEQQNNLKQQLSFFDFQINLSNQFKKPLIVHHRKSHPEVSQLLKQYQPPKAGIIHAFSGSYQQASQYLDLGFKLGIGGTISYQRAKKTLNTVKKLPLTSLVLETDAPAMPLAGNQGTPNSPLHVTDVFNYLVAIRSESPEQIAEQLEKNLDQVLN